MNSPDLYSGHDICITCGHIWQPDVYRLRKDRLDHVDDGWHTVGLLGMTIHDVRMSDDKQNIAFETCADFIKFHTFGDCCSTSWIENCTNVENLRGSMVTLVEDVQMPVPIQEGDDYLQSYGWKLHLADPKTWVAKPAFFLEFRNSSNGYYGGELHRGDISAIDFYAYNALKQDF